MEMHFCGKLQVDLTFGLLFAIALQYAHRLLPEDCILKIYAHSIHLRELPLRTQLELP